VTELQVIAVMYDASKWICQKVEKMPRSYRFTLGDRLVNASLDIYLLLVEAQYTDERKLVLKRANRELEKLRHILRLAHDLTPISLKSYQYISEQLNQVGKMIGGWAKTS
jgi:four helix bundle protein